MTPPSDSQRSHVVEDQSAAFRLLEDPATHGIDGPVTRIDTHGAAVFLAGPHAYKVKRAVRFPFMDFSTLEKRRIACLAEVEISGPGAPGVYLGVVPVTEGPDGLRLGGDGRPVEWALHMRRFDETATLDRLADRGALTPGMLAELVDAVRASHLRAPLRSGAAATDALARYVDQNRAAFAENADVFPAARAAALCDRTAAEISRLRPLLEARGGLGLVRRCHGDLHLRNAVLIDGRPTLFDAVEFDDGIATCDLLYDLAYLVMDLWERGRRAEANLVLNRYMAAADASEIPGLSAMPLFLSIRATIRAKVIAAARPSMPEADRPRGGADALRYFEVAEAVLAPVPAVCVAVGGLSGTGKSTVSAALAPSVGRAPGAIHLRSDVLRKRLAGRAETERLPPEAYTPAATAEVYAALRDRAGAVLRTGTSVIVDAVHARPEERAAMEAVAAQAGAVFAGIWLAAPLDRLVERVNRRSGDASDATEAVVLRQAGYDLGEIAWPVVAADRAPAEVVADGLARVERAVAAPAD